MGLEGGSKGSEVEKDASQKSNDGLGLKSSVESFGWKNKTETKTPSKKDPTPAPKTGPTSSLTVLPTPSSAPVKSNIVTPPPRPAKTNDGLPDEALTQIAQAKFELLEDKLRDVARQSITLLRDFHKMDATECSRKITDIKKSLLKYEMLFIRAGELQEQRRRLEIKDLEAMTQRFSQEALEEGGKIVELREVLEKERRRRKRYESYEEIAAEVNKKKTRTESQAEIEACKTEIERLQRQQRELEAFTELRNQRAQLLREAVAELKRDLQREQELRQEVLGSAEVAAAASGASGEAEQSPSADIEVIS
jgi:hypothetical protein